MNDRVNSLVWRGSRKVVTMARRLSPHVQPPLMAPVTTSQSSRRNFRIGIVIVIIMVIGVGSLLCCCYRLQVCLRIQAHSWRRAQYNGHGAPQASSGVQAAPGAHPQPVPDAVSQEGQLNVATRMEQDSSVSVMMPGDNIPRFLAWAAPHGSPPHPANSVSLPHQELTVKNR